MDEFVRRMRQSLGNIRFEEMDRFLRRRGSTPRSGGGSHVVNRREDGLRGTIVRPHGGHKTVNRDAIREVLGLLDVEQSDREDDDDR